MKARLGRMADERLAGLVGRGDAAAFEALYDRHHVALLAFCRHMVGNREDGEDALQQAFLRAHKALADGRAPDRVRPWLFAIARNRCLTLIAARRDAALPADELEPSFDGLGGDVQRRADLRELVTDLGRLPDDQRGALVLAELGDFSHPEIARVIGCSPAKVKALVFQARTTLIADRDARRTPCDEIRTLLETARGAVLRRGALRRHLRQCDPCAAYRVAMEGRRTGLALVLPVAPTAGLKAAVLAGAGGLGGGAETAAAAAALLAPGAARRRPAAGSPAAPPPPAAWPSRRSSRRPRWRPRSVPRGGGVAVHDLARDEPVRAAAIERVAERLPAEAARRADGAGAARGGRARGRCRAGRDDRAGGAGRRDGTRGRSRPAPASRGAPAAGRRPGGREAGRAGVCARPIRPSRAGCAAGWPARGAVPSGAEARRARRRGPPRAAAAPAPAGGPRRHRPHPGGDA